MVSVTGYTAERMKAIEDASVVNGEIDVNGHLILSRFDESTIDAGIVRDPPELIVCTSATRPTVGLYAGLRIYETDTLCSMIYNGTDWDAFSEGSILLSMVSDAGGVTVNTTDTLLWQTSIVLPTGWSSMAYMADLRQDFFEAEGATNNSFNTRLWLEVGAIMVTPAESSAWFRAVEGITNAQQGTAKALRTGITATETLEIMARRPTTASANLKGGQGYMSIMRFRTG